MDSSVLLIFSISRNQRKAIFQHFYEYVPLEKIIVQTPSSPYFKGVGMRNLQSKIRIFQKVHNKVILTVKLL